MISSKLTLTNTDINNLVKSIENSNKIIDNQLSIFNDGFVSQVNFNLIESSVKFINRANQTLERGYLIVK